MNFFKRAYYDFIISNRSTFLDGILARVDRVRSFCAYDIYAMSGVEEDVMTPTGVSANVLIRPDGTVEITRLSDNLMLHDEEIIQFRPRRRNRFR